MNARNRAMGSFRRGGQDSGGRALVICCIVSLVLFTMGIREGDSGLLHGVRSGATVVTTPVRVVGGALASPFVGLGNVFTNLTASQESLSDLKSQNEELQAKVTELSEAEQTATRLEGLLQLQNTYSLQSTAARIVSGSTDSWSTTVTIDKGSASGLAVGMPVSDSGGVIGQISACGPTSATVRLLADENSSVSAMLQASRAQGMLRGSADGTLKLDMIQTDLTVNVGDTVVTSGLGGVFPKGLPLGKVTSVNKPTGAIYYEIVVQPFTTAQSYEEVLVITSLTDDQKATSDDMSAADSQDSSSTASTTSATTSATTTSK
ncbi:MAG: rod shape-determining protein MreC [Atopobiaceae bacterium]